MRRFFVLSTLLTLACGGPPPAPPPFIDWANLKNPILAEPDRCLKNQSVVRHGGKFWLFAFQRFADGDTTGRARIYSSDDLTSFSPHEPEHLEKLSTSDLLEHEGRFHLLTQTHSTHTGSPLRLLHTTSADLQRFEPLKEIAPQNVPEQRQIDGTLAFVNGRFVLGYKGDQNFYVMQSLGPALDGRWSAPLPASADGEWAEAFHFMQLDGKWRMVATGRDPKGWRCLNPYVCSHEPFLYEMDGDGSKLEHFGKWVNRRQLKVPIEAWNKEMHANGASLNDWRNEDGHYYLFYAGSDDQDSYGGRSHCKIGVVRSRDLVTWKLPGDLSE
jgi:hypothetical protein